MYENISYLSFRQLRFLKNAAILLLILDKFQATAGINNSNQNENDNTSQHLKSLIDVIFCQQNTKVVAN